jgi:hypothetical protein
MHGQTLTKLSVTMTLSVQPNVGMSRVSKQPQTMNNAQRNISVMHDRPSAIQQSSANPLIKISEK